MLDDISMGDNLNENNRVRNRELEEEESMEEPAPQRPRMNQEPEENNIPGFSLPEPYNNSRISRSAIRNTALVTLNNLSSENAEPIMRSAINVQILRIIVHNPHENKGSSGAQVYGRSKSYGPVRPSSMPYTRLLLCRVFSKIDGSLLVYIMESPSLNKNNNLWLNNVELRDNGVITIGTVFRIICPLPITSYLRGDVPLIETLHPVIVLKSPKTYYEHPPVENLQGETSRAFTLNGATLYNGSFSCEKTKCGGAFCDRQRVTDWNTPLGSCGCYAQKNRGTNNLTLLYPLVKIIHSSKSFMHRNLSSHSFTRLFLSNNFPIGVQANDLQLTDDYWTLGDDINSIIGLVNRNGGWTIVGWYSRGTITDKTLTTVITGSSSSSTNQQNNTEVQVDGGDLIYHFCKIIPTDSSFLQDNSVLNRELKDLKFNVNTIHTS